MRFWFPALAVTIALALPAGAQAQLQVGYALLNPDAGSGTPVGSALFSYTNAGGVLVSQAGVGALAPIRSGRIIVDEVGTQTGIALVNTSEQAAAVTWILRDDLGNEFARRTTPLEAHQQVAQFVSELFPQRPPGLTGSLNFESDQLLAAITLRQSLNALREPMYTTLPVIDPATQASGSSLVFPQVAAGAGYTTQLLLINTTSQTIRGSVALTASDGQPLLVRLQGSTVAEFPYQIAPQGIYRAELDRPPGLGVGYAKVTPDAGSAIPAGSAIFQLKSGGALVTEAGVAATPTTTAARIFVDYIGTQTGVAVANPGDAPADLTLTLMDRFGTVEMTISQRLPARNHMAKFVHELFPTVSDGYTGLVEIRSSSAIVPVTLKLTTNSRNDLVLTTLPVADLTQPPAAGSLVFPQIALGGGFTTRLILLNTSTAKTAQGNIAFYQTGGSALLLPMGGQTGSRFNYQILPGGGRQTYPGNGARIASVSLVDPSSGQITNELVVNEGNTVRPRLRMLDSAGAIRDDFDPAVVSIDPAIAPVDSSGAIQGKKAGFSSLTIAVADVVVSATATVVKLDAGVSGFEPAGIVQDSARRLYLASPSDNTILLAQNLKQAPQVYAGISRSAGLKDGLRLQSLFENPSFLAMDQVEGSLFVSDGANHVIRRVRPGPAGRVETLNGVFSNPQGVALDGRGNLWVADAGNHTIQKINLLSGSVQTIAGQAGAAGALDGRGAQARFNSPAGIAVEIETAVQALERERTGAPPPPVTIIVADSGNGIIRRVKETGDVETIGAVQSRFSLQSDLQATFASPAGVAVDLAGNIFVAEPAAGRVRTILTNGRIVSAAQAGTFVGPKGIVIAQDGKVVVASRDRAAQEIFYGTPQIASVSPARIGNRGGQKITVKGSNFSSDTSLMVAATVISDRVIVDTQTITFTAPALPSGRHMLAVRNRGGYGQVSFTVDSVPLSQLPAGYITTVAGGSTYAGEGTAATEAPINPLGMAVDTNGNVFVADQGNRKVRRIDGRSGVITTVAGNGNSDGAGDKVPAVTAALSYPNGVAFDPAGNLLISAGGIRKVDAATGIISTTIRGDYGFCGDGGKALDACFNYITGFAIDARGNVFIADRYNARIRRVDAITQIITTIAGNGETGFSGDGGAAKAAALNSPFGVAVDDARKLLYIADAGNNRVRQVDLSTNIITTVAGGGSLSNGIGDNQRATTAVLSFPTSLAIDAAGNLLIADRGNGRIRKLELATGIITTVAGSDGANSTGDGGPATAASIQDPFGVAIDGAGNILIAEYYACVVRRVDSATGIITTLAGNRQCAVVDDNVQATATTLRYPVGVTIDAAGNLFITDSDNDRIRRVDAATGIITTIAGGGHPETGIGDGGPAKNAVLSIPRGRVALDADGNLYIADRYNYRVRKVDLRTNIITTVAGNGQLESSGDGLLATSAGVLPDDLALDRNGNLYIAENDSHRIRKVNLFTGIITSVAAGTLGSEFRIAVDSMDNLFIADTESRRILRVEGPGVRTVAGGGSLYPENQPATAVSLLPIAIDIDAAGNIFIVDYSYPYGIRKISVETGLITGVAGTNPRASLGDNGPAIAASLYYPLAVSVDARGNLFIADSNQRIRAVRGPIP